MAKCMTCGKVDESMPVWGQWECRGCVVRHSHVSPMLKKAKVVMDTVEQPSPKRSPWGEVQHTEVLMPGITRVTTSSHGGYKVAKELMELLPLYCQRPFGWYEEDVDWSILYCAFGCFLRAKSQGEAEMNARNLAVADETMKNDLPEAYCELFNCTLTAADSRELADREWAAANKGKWMGISAMEDKDGSVLVLATIDGQRRMMSPMRKYRLTSEEYDTRGTRSFVFGDHHKPIAENVTSW